MTEDILTKTLEHEAILRCQQGDQEAFRRVLDFHGDHLFRTAALITRDESIAEEVLQETLFRAWKKIRHFKAGTNLRAWLNRLLINSISNVNSKKQVERVSEDLAIGVADPGAGPEEAALSAEVMSMLKQAMRQLTIEHRTVLVLRLVNELSLQEISDSTGWKIGTVNSRLNRAKSALRSVLTSHPEPLIRTRTTLSNEDVSR